MPAPGPANHSSSWGLTTGAWHDPHDPQTAHQGRVCSFDSQGCAAVRRKTAGSTASHRPTLTMPPTCLVCVQSQSSASCWPHRASHSGPLVRYSQYHLCPVLSHLCPVLSVPDLSARKKGQLVAAVRLVRLQPAPSEPLHVGNHCDGARWHRAGEGGAVAFFVGFHQ
jgi:hypothetical protein